MKKLLVLALAIMMTLAVSGCQKKSIEVEIGYNYKDSAGGMHAQMPEGTLKDLMDDFAKTGDFSYEVDDNGFLSSVNGIGNDDDGYWEIYKNDELVGDKIKDVKLADGDIFRVVYCSTVIDTPAIAGGWQTAEIGRIQLTDDEKAVFDKGMEGIVGVSYEPVCVLATQLVAGTNYAFLAYGTTVTANPESSYYIVAVNEDLDGNAELKGINKLDVLNIAVEEGESGPMVGAWEVNDSGKPGSFGSNEAQSSFDKAVAEVDGILYNPIQLLATQLVAGMNYTGLVVGKTVGMEDNPALYVITWYADLQGNSTITDVKKLNLNYYVAGL